MNTLIYDQLKELGIPTSLSGHKYLVYALELFLKDERKYSVLSKWTYPEISRAFNTSIPCVERAIRTAINASTSKPSGEIYKIVGNALNPSKGGVPTKQFISSVALEIRKKNASSDLMAEKFKQEWV